MKSPSSSGGIRPFFVSHGFDNATILPPRLDRPHIVRVDGIWRVSKAPKNGGMEWTQAHSHARKLYEADKRARQNDHMIARHAAHRGAYEQQQ